ncbi:MAG: DUF1616 domain-containing protein [Desulfurococcaceae archaeon]
MERRRTTLEEYVNGQLKRKGNKYAALQEAWKGAQEGKLKLEDPNPPLTLISYAFRLDYTLWFWTAAILSTLTLVLIYLADYLPLLTPARYVLGTIYVLFIPGYSLVEALYPRKEDLTPLERVALSIGLSLAVIPLVGLLLNYTPWGIRLAPIITSTALFIATMLVISLYRKFSYIKLNINRSPRS